MWRANESIGLPVYEGEAVVGSVRKEAGETITKAEMTAAKQSDASIAELVKHGAIEEA